MDFFKLSHHLHAGQLILTSKPVEAQKRGKD